MPSDLFHNLRETLSARNDNWKDHPLIPHWVNLETVGLDQFMTRPEIAKLCHDALLSWMAKDGADTSLYRFVEPAAGTGAFYDLLPSDRRTGLDLMPMRPGLEAKDFLSWAPSAGRYAVVGNPPFGYRAWLALAFMNHAATFADYVGLILPMAFQSEGKGSPRHRVDGLRLQHQEVLPPDSFVTPDGKSAKINALWQIWQRGVNNSHYKIGCRDWLDLFTVDMRKERLCGQKRLHEADYFLQRTFYQEPPQLVTDFSQVRYVSGYGLVIKKDEDRIVDTLNSADWRQYSNLAAHNCRHISMYHIRNVLADAGFVNV